MPAELPPDLLRAFIAVAESRSFTSAASTLNRTQSAVSMQVKRLEHLTGQRLLQRGHRDVTLTLKGERLLEHARCILELNDQALAELGLEDVTGRVRIGLPEDFTSHFLPPVLASFARNYPGVELEVSCALSMRLLEDLAAGRLDLALATQMANGGGAPVRREHLVWVSTTNSDIHEQEPVPLALFPKGCVFRAAALKAMEDVGRDVRTIYTSTSVSGIRAAVAAGLAVGVMARSTLPENARMLEPQEGFPVLPEVEVGLHYAKGSLTKPAKALADYILQMGRDSLAEQG